VEYRGIRIEYSEPRQVGTLPYQISLRSNDPRMASLLKTKFGKNLPIVCESQVLEDAVEKAKRIIDEMLSGAC